MRLRRRILANSEPGAGEGNFAFLASVLHKYCLPSGDFAEDRRRVARGPILFVISRSPVQSRVSAPVFSMGYEAFSL